MKRIIQVVMTLILVIFTLNAIHEINTNNQQIRLQQIKLRDTQAELDKLDQEYQLLQEDKTKTLEQKEAEIKQWQEKVNSLESQLQARRLLKQQQAVAYAATKPKAAPVGCDGVRSALAAAGISGSELNAAVELARLESGCNQYARNKSSGACNVFQEYPCGKWGGTGSLNAHLYGAIGYARASYGSFNNALTKWHSRSPHWW